MTLDHFEIFVPNTTLSVKDMEQETGLPKAMLSLYQVIYGLKTISVYKSGDLESLLSQPLKKILNKKNSRVDIKYLIYVHTAAIQTAYGDHILAKLKKSFQLNTAITYEMTLQKCVSYFKALSLLEILLVNKPRTAGIILTGEVAFSPQLRVVPRSSIVGDAATATIISNAGQDNHLLSLTNRFIPNFSNGFYLRDEEIQRFDQYFIQWMVNTINETLLKANVSIRKLAIILPHNINLPTWRKIASAIHYPIEKVYLENISKIGHSFCSDHIINLSSAIAEKRLVKGDYYLMAGCGMGFFLSAALFRY